MNTKTTKFLSVLAVFAVAFAVFAVTLPAESNDADTPITPAPVAGYTVDGESVSGLYTLTLGAVDNTATLETGNASYLVTSASAGNLLTPTINAISNLYVTPNVKLSIAAITEGTTIYIASYDGTAITTYGKIVVTSLGAATAFTVANDSGTYKLTVSNEAAVAVSAIDVKSSGAIVFGNGTDATTVTASGAITNAGALTVAASSILNANGAITNSGTLTANGNVTIAVDSTNSGTINVGAAVDLAANKKITNTGTISIGTGGAFTVTNASTAGSAGTFGIVGTSGKVAITDTGVATIGKGHNGTAATNVYLIQGTIEISSISADGGLNVGGGLAYGGSSATVAKLGSNVVFTITSTTGSTATANAWTLAASQKDAAVVTEANNTITAPEATAFDAFSTVAIGEGIIVKATANGLTLASGTLTLAGTIDATGKVVAISEGAVLIDNNPALESITAGTYTNNGTYKYTGEKTEIRAWGGSGIVICSSPDVSEETEDATLAVNPDEITDAAIKTIYISQDSIVKVKAAVTALTVYVNNGCTVELKFGSAFNNDTSVTIVTVSGDRTAKTVFEQTLLKFEADANTTFEYTAAIITSSGSLASNPYTYAKFYYSGTLVMSSAGSRTAIAAGEEIEFSADPSAKGFAYGVVYKGSGATWFATAPGEKVSTVLTASADAIHVSNATVTVKYGTAYAKFTGVSGGSITVTSDGTLQVTGNLPSYSTLTLTGNVILSMAKNDGTIIVSKDATIVIGTGANETPVTNNGVIELNSENPVYCAHGNEYPGILNNGTVKVNEPALWVTTGEETAKYVLGIKTTSTGLIDTSGATAVAELHNDVVSMTIYPKQTYVVTNNTRITGDLLVKGILIINEGVTLTIEEDAKMVIGVNDSGITGYAQVINNGTIVVKVKPTTAGGVQATNHGLTINDYATLVNNGLIQTSSSASLSSTVANADALVIDSANFLNNGTLTVGPSDIAQFNAGVYGGTVTVSGDAYSGANTVNVTGTFVLNSAKLKTGNLIIDLAAKNAKFSIVQVEVLKGMTITVKNSSMVTSSYTTTNAATVTITADPSLEAGKVVFLGSVDFTASEYKSGSTWNKQLIMSGMVSANTNDTNTSLTNVATLAATGGRVTVSDSLTLPSKVTMTVAKMAVSGTVFASTGSSLSITELSSVTGEISGAGVTVSDASSNYAKYYANTAVGYVYTSLPKAMEGVAELANKIVMINGKLTLSENLTVPAGYTIAGSGLLTIGSSTNSSPVLTIKTNGGYSAGAVTCYGTLYAETENNLSSTVYADVKIKEGNSVTYTNFAKAVATGLPMTLMTGPAGTGIVVSNDLTIPASAVVNISNATNGITIKGSDLVIEGTFLIPGLLLNVEDSHTSEASVSVDGFLKLKAMDRADKWWYPAGVHYSETIDDVQYYTTTSVANIAQAVQDTDDNEISITADETIPDVAITGTGAEPVVVNIAGDNVKTGILTLDNAVLIFDDGIATLDTTVTNGDGSIIITNARPSSLTITEDGTLVMSGALYDPEVYETYHNTKYYKAYGETYSVTFLGETYITKFTAHMWDGDYDNAGGTAEAAIREYSEASGIESPAISIVGKLYAEGRSNTFYSAVTIYGEMIADNSARITFENEVYVVGSLVAKEKTSSTAAGVIFLNENTYVGSTKYQIFDKKLMNVAGTATLDGEVTVASEKLLFVTAGSNVDDEILEDLAYAVMQVEGDTFLIVYGNGTADFDVTGLMLPVTSGKVIKFVDADGEEVDRIAIDTNGTVDFYNNVRAFTDGNLPMDKDGKVYNAISKYDIYGVMIKTDASIKAVYIDGALMTTSMMANVFMKDDVVIGKHTITVEPVTGYDASKCYLYLDDGTKLTGMTFIFDESDCKEVVGEAGDVTYTVTYNVAGTELVPEPSPVEQSEWTITTILLVILVILIAIMAVIVALRLNRS